MLFGLSLVSHHLLYAAAIILFDTGCRIRWLHGSDWRKRFRMNGTIISGSLVLSDCLPLHLSHDMCSTSGTRGIGTGRTMDASDSYPSISISTLKLFECSRGTQGVRSISVSSIVHCRTMICHCSDGVADSLSEERMLCSPALCLAILPYMSVNLLSLLPHKYSCPLLPFSDNRASYSYLMCHTLYSIPVSLGPFTIHPDRKKGSGAWRV